MLRTPSGASVIAAPGTRGSSSRRRGARRSLAPAGGELVREPDLVEDARDDEVDERGDRRLAVVEAGREREDRRARAAEREHVLELDRRERRLARAEHELALLLERDRGRPVDEVLADAGRERAERPGRAG